MTRRVSIVEHELLILPGHLSWAPVFSGVHMAQTLVFCVLFCKSLFVIVFLFFCQLYWLSFYFGILWSLYWLFFLDLQLLIASLVSYGHCIVCSSIYSYWLPLWYLMVIVLAVLLRFTATDCLFGILWSLYWLSLDIRLLIASLVSYGHCIVCSFLDLQLLIASLVSYGHYIGCPS